MYAEVQHIEQLSPTLLRITLGGGTISEFENSPATDAYINARFVPEDSPVSVPFEPEDIADLPSHLRPKPRRFTIRSWDPSTQQLAIDFVAHGDSGYAGTWAQRAQIGDRLQFSGPGGSYRPDPDADWHLLIGDESAFGAIGASLESLAATDVAVVFAVVDSADHEIDFPSDADVRTYWVHRSTAADPETVLAETVASAQFPSGTFDVFLHGEAAEVRAVRNHLISERGVDADTASISPYWRRSHTDEEWRSVKRQWLAEQSRDSVAAPA